MARTKSHKTAEDIKAANKEDTLQEDIALATKLIPSGNTMLNLACSDRAHGAFIIGTIVNIIGDSFAGKTVQALTCMAELCRGTRFEDYRLIYDPVEPIQINLKQMYGQRLLDRLEILEDKDKSETVEDFRNTVLTLIAREEPFVYVLDSLDGLSTNAELGRFEKERKGQDGGGSYGNEVSRVLTPALRKISQGLEATDSVIIIISQVRENIDTFSPEKYRRTGGKALKHYCAHEIWLHGKKKIRKKDRVTGSNVGIKITKNKVTGKIRTTDTIIYNEYGVDDIGAQIEFLLKEKVFTKSGKSNIKSPTFKFKGTKVKFIKHIEDNNREGKLRQLTSKTWLKIEESLKMNRKRRYE